MQIPGMQVQVPALPSPPMLQRLVLEEPLTLTIVLVVAGVIGFYLLNRAARARQAVVCGVGGVVLAILVQVLAAAVKTDRERIMEATTELVRTTAHAEMAGLSRLLAPEVRFSNDFNLTAPEVQVEGSLDKEQLLSKVRSFMTGPYRVKEAAVLELQGVIDREGVGRTQVRVRVVTESQGYLNISWWRIDWVRKDGEWVVRGIQPVDLGLGGLGG